MKNIYILFKFHMSSCEKKQRIINTISLLLIVSVLLTIAFFLDVYTNRQISVLKNGQYDLMITGFSKNNLEEITKQSFIKKVKPWVNILVKDINNGGVSMDSNLMLVDNFEDMTLTYFPDKLCIKKSNEILTNKSKNPIIIDTDIAKTLHVGLGDKVYVNFDGKNTITCIVAAVYEATLFVTGRPACVALLANEQLNILQNIYGKNLEYGTAFISVNNIEAAKNYFNKNIMADLSLIKSYGSDWKNKLKKDSWEKYIEQPVYRVDQLYAAYKESDFAPPIVVVFCIVSIFAIAFVQIREYQKTIEKKSSDFKILYIIGYPKIFFFIYFLLMSFLGLIMMTLIGILFTKFIMYDFFMGLLYLPVYRIFHYSPYIILTSCLASFFVAISAVRSISLKSLNYLKGW